jgi:hypothetical protein
MDFAVKTPKYSYIDSSKKVHLVCKRNLVYPLCNGKVEYFSIPIMLKHYKSYQNALVAYARENDCKQVLNSINDAQIKTICCTVESAIHVSEMLSMPLVVILSSHNDEVFFKPKRLKQ